MNWDYVFSADAIIVEANEAAIGEAGYGLRRAGAADICAVPSPHRERRGAA